jgi:serine/threonine protein kinase
MGLAGGTRLGQYEVVAPLGAGGMGEVYRARDTRLGREVAIKVLPAERLSDERRRARFVREARAASALNHPNIVTVHEIDAAGDVDFIVMELVPGETLARILHRGPLPTEEALRIAIPVADALAAAHAAGIVHRDLKPSNVMVAPDRTVKVLDFGLAKLVRGETAESDETTATVAPEAPLSRPGAMTGTAGYMSPEQATGRDVDARSDIFSFGVLLYEMVTGRRAFAGDSSAETIAALLKDEPKPPTELAPGVPRELERIIARCLRKEPGRRFQHVEDVRVELQEVREESDSAAWAGPAGRRRRSSPLLARPTTGGMEQTIIRCVPFPFGYAVGPEGVLHLNCNTPTTEDPSRRTLRLWEARTGQDRAIATLDTGEGEPTGLSVSPDGRTILYTRGSATADLMMIENFR